MCFIPLTKPQNIKTKLNNHRVAVNTEIASIYYTQHAVQRLDPPLNL